MAKTKHKHPLLEWAEDNDISINQMVAEMGISRTGLHYWNTGERMPRRFLLQMIIDYTDGKVTVEACHQYWLSKQRKAA